MGRTACTEPQCLYKGDLYLYCTHLFFFRLYKLGCSPNGSVGIYIDHWGIKWTLSSWQAIFFPLPKSLDHFWGPPSFCFVGTGLLPAGGGSFRDMKPSIQLHLVQSWVRGAIPPLPHMSLLLRQGKLYSLKLGNGKVVNLRVRGEMAHWYRSLNAI